MSIFEQALERNSANFEPLSPISFLRRAAQVVPEHTAIIHGERRTNYLQFWERSCRLASALAAHGIGPGDCVAIMGANTPEMLEAHNGVPLLGAVLNSLNVRLDSATIAFILDHGEARAVLTDRAFSATMREALALLVGAPGDFDAALIDLTMPDWPGERAAAGLRRVREDLPIVFMTGHSEREALERTRGIDRTHFLAKPFRRELLAKALSELLETG